MPYSVRYSFCGELGKEVKEADYFMVSFILVYKFLPKLFCFVLIIICKLTRKQKTD